MRPSTRRPRSWSPSVKDFPISRLRSIVQQKFVSVSKRVQKCRQSSDAKDFICFSHFAESQLTSLYLHA